MKSMAREDKSPLVEDNISHPQDSHLDVINTDPDQISLLTMVTMSWGPVILLALSIIILAHESLQALGSMDLPKINPLATDNRALHQDTLQAVASMDLVQVSLPATDSITLKKVSLPAMANMDQDHISLLDTGAMG
jgi:hypothetical protein